MDTWTQRLQELKLYMDTHHTWPDRADPNARLLDRWVSIQHQKCTSTEHCDLWDAFLADYDKYPTLINNKSHYDIFTT